MQDCMYSTTRQFFPWDNSRRFRLEWFTHVSQYGYGYQQRKHQQQFVKSSVVVKNEKHVYIVMMVHMLNMKICLLAGSPRMYSFSLLILSFLVDRQRRKLRKKERNKTKLGETLSLSGFGCCAYGCPCPHISYTALMMIVAASVAMVFPGVMLNGAMVAVAVAVDGCVLCCEDRCRCLAQSLEQRCWALLKTYQREREREFACLDVNAIHNFFQGHERALEYVLCFVLQNNVLLLHIL